MNVLLLFYLFISNRLDIVEMFDSNGFRCLNVFFYGLHEWYSNLYCC